MRDQFVIRIMITLYLMLGSGLLMAESTPGDELQLVLQEPIDMNTGWVTLEEDELNIDEILYQKMKTEISKPSFSANIKQGIFKIFARTYREKSLCRNVPEIKAYLDCRKFLSGVVAKETRFILVLETEIDCVNSRFKNLAMYRYEPPTEQITGSIGMFFKSSHKYDVWRYVDQNKRSVHSALFVNYCPDILASREAGMEALQRENDILRQILKQKLKETEGMLKQRM